MMKRVRVIALRSALRSIITLNSDALNLDADLAERARELERDIRARKKQLEES